MYLSECQSLCAVLEGLSLVWVLILTFFLSKKGFQSKQVCIISRYFSSYKIPLKSAMRLNHFKIMYVFVSLHVLYHFMCLRRWNFMFFQLLLSYWLYRLLIIHKVKESFNKFRIIKSRITLIKNYNKSLFLVKKNFLIIYNW